MTGSAAMRPTPEYLKRATVYQIVLRSFTRDGDFKAATKMLEHVRSAGVDVVYVTPFVAMDCDMDRSGWSPRQIRSGYGSPKNPYRISDYDRIDPEYGHDADFQAFNDKAHALGMKVFMDLVYLHCGPSNVLKDKFPDAFLKNPDGTVKTTNYRFPYINFGSKDVRKYLIDSMLHWMRLGCDGFRCDVGDKVPIDFWVEAVTACQKVNPELVMINEGQSVEWLRKAFDAFLPGGLKNRCCPRPCHVDDSVFGVLPYEIHLGNKDPRCLALGNSYADAQWTPPSEGTLAVRDAAPAERQSAYWAKGYTPQTRLWIDDMYMITALQGQAFRATGKRAYIDRAAREMCFYLDELQLREGPAAGLFYHAPDVKYVWGRGAGWMAAGMALVLDRLPPDSGCRARIKRGYRLMMAALLKYQRDDGLWSQLVDRPDDPRNWGETSCTAMFAYAFMTGVARGWLDPAKYGPAARKAWDALCARLDDFANVSDVCIGTGKKDDLQYYFDRPRVNGDPHGQAPILWMASVLLETKSGVVTGLRTPATSRLFEKRIDPVSGVVSWALSGGVATNVQSQYFTSKTMTDDGRFLLVDLSQNERILDFDAKGRPKANPPANRKYAALVDFLKDELIPMPDVPWQIPFVDTKDDYMVYSRDRAFYRRDFRDPSAERRLCAFPPEIRDSANRGGYPYTHLTLTPDRKKAFLDSCLVRADGTTNYVQGVVELATGKYTSWGRTDFFANHGQMNPARGDLAMCAWEACWKTPDAKAYRAAHGDRYPRMWLVRPDGSREMAPPVANYAVHEIWDDDGRGFSWCGRGVWHQSLDAPLGRQQEQLCPDPRAWHCRLSADNAYVVYDATPCATWRGSPWAVRFFNRATKRTIEVFSARPALLPRWHESRKHPDPHPHFSGDGRWVISTANNARGNMEVYLTSVDQLVARTTMAPPTGGTTVIVENPLGVVRGAETVSVKWKELGLRPGDASVRVWDVAACAPVAYQDDAGRGALIFSTGARPLQPKERREYRILSDASLPQADLSIVCWSQHLPERMDDFAWENDRFGARAYGPVIMEPPPRGQALVSSGVDVLNKCVSYPVLHRWLVEDPDRGAYHRDRGEGMDVYNVGLGRGCGGLGAVDATNAWAFSRNWSKARMIQCGPVRTEFELTYPAWGGFGEETRRVTLDRGQHFAHCRVAFKGAAPAVGAFKSSDERLNRVFDTAVRTAALCCQDYVWDGIKRDRLVWAGDLHPETMTILSVFGAAPVLRDSLDYMMALTDPETGWMDGSFPTYTLWWLRNCAEWYRFTGDAKFLADRLDYVEKTFDHVATLVKDGEGWTSATVHGCFLDWPTHGDPVAERAGAQALALMTARDVAFLGREAGRTRLVEKAEAVAAKLARLRPDPHGAKSSAALLALGGLRDAREMFDEVLGKGGHAGVSTFYGYSLRCGHQRDLRRMRGRRHSRGHPLRWHRRERLPGPDLRARRTSDVPGVRHSARRPARAARRRDPAGTRPGGERAAEHDHGRRGLPSAEHSSGRRLGCLPRRTSRRRGGRRAWRPVRRFLSGGQHVPQAASPRLRAVRPERGRRLAEERALRPAAGRAVRRIASAGLWRETIETGSPAVRSPPP